MVPMDPAIPPVLMDKLLLSKVTHRMYAIAHPLSITQGLCFSNSYCASLQSPLLAPPHLLDRSIFGKFLLKQYLFSVYTHACDLIQPRSLLNTTYIPIMPRFFSPAQISPLILDSYSTAHLLFLFGYLMGTSNFTKLLIFLPKLAPLQFSLDQ